MKLYDFNKLNNYLGKDDYAYLIIKRNKFLEPSDWRSQLYLKIKEIVSPEKLIHINVNFLSENHINLQSISKNNKSNALLVKRDVLIEVFGTQMEIDFGIAKKIIFVKTKESINRQANRKFEKTKNIVSKKEKIDRNIQSILKGEKNWIPMKEWIVANKEVLKQKSTTCERIVFNKLSKSLKKRVQRQTPFTINGNIYFADICIKCKKLIIEIDGGYHNLESQRNKDDQRDKDFSSIGYRTIRITNENVRNSEALRKIIKDIIDTPNARKSN